MLLIMFVCYLRPSELLRLRVQDLVHPTLTKKWHGLLLHPQEDGQPSKTGIYDDGVSMDNVYAPWLGKWVEQWLQRKRPTDLMFGIKYEQLRLLFVDVMKRLGLADPSMYRLRHGGASEDAARKVRSIAAIKKRVRWRCDASLSRYEKHVRLQWSENHSKPEAPSRAALISINLRRLFGN